MPPPQISSSAKTDSRPAFDGPKILVKTWRLPFFPRVEPTNLDPKLSIRETRSSQPPRKRGGGLAVRPSIRAGETKADATVTHRKENPPPPSFRSHRPPPSPRSLHRRRERGGGEGGPNSQGHSFPHRNNNKKDTRGGREGGPALM